MRDVVSGIEVHIRGASDSTKQEDRAHTLAIYGAFALIAAIVFGTLSYRPF